MWQLKRLCSLGPLALICILSQRSKDPKETKEVISRSRYGPQGSPTFLLLGRAVKTTRPPKVRFFFPLCTDCLA